jgi:hypothetical protein
MQVLMFVCHKRVVSNCLFRDQDDFRGCIGPDKELLLDVLFIQKAVYLTRSFHLIFMSLLVPDIVRTMTLLRLPHPDPLLLRQRPT